MGELENEDQDYGMERLFEQLESRGYEQFEVVKKIFPQEGHCSVVAPGLQAGLKFSLSVE